MLQSVWDELTQIADVATARDDEEATLERAIEDADLVITCYARIGPKVIEAGKNLKAILKWGVGVDNIDIDTATERGLPVVHCPNYGTATVAEHAFALMIGLARKIVPLDRTMREKGWMWPSSEYSGADLADKTLGVIGLGRIGSAMARRAEAFGMSILACDPYVDGDATPRKDLQFAGLDELLERSDFISIHAVLTDETRGLLGENEFKKMKKTAFLINTARGAIVDEAALFEALTEHRIAGAGIDVYPGEPLGSDHPLLGLDNVILTPHFAYYTKEADARLDREALCAAMDILNDRPPVHIKNPTVLEKLAGAP